MNYKVYTAVTTEPVTLTETKQHLRLSSYSFGSDVLTSQSILPGSHAIAASYSLVGAAVDVLGKVPLVNLNAGTVGSGGTVTAKIQESDDNTTWADWTGGAFTVVNSANDDAPQKKTYTGTKRYVRVVATVAGAACEFGVDVITQSGDSTEDDLITALITAAREYCEGITGRALATQTVEMYLDRFPCKNEIELRRPPLQSVTSVKYTDSDGDETTMTVNTEYKVDTDRNVGRIVLPYGKSWPSFTADTVNPIKIRYVCGYYASNPIPKCIKQAMLLMIGLFYEYRGDVMEALEHVPPAVKILLAMYKVWWFE